MSHTPLLRYNEAVQIMREGGFSRYDAEKMIAAGIVRGEKKRPGGRNYYYLCDIQKLLSPDKQTNHAGKKD